MILKISKKNCIVFWFSGDFVLVRKCPPHEFKKLITFYIMKSGGAKPSALKNIFSFPCMEEGRGKNNLWYKQYFFFSEKGCQIVWNSQNSGLISEIRVDSIKLKLMLLPIF